MHKYFGQVNLGSPIGNAQIRRIQKDSKSVSDPYADDHAPKELLLKIHWKRTYNSVWENHFRTTLRLLKFLTQQIMEQIFVVLSFAGYFESDKCMGKLG